ncbi:hypothetical protein CEXT_312931 [Caerostris extrusa]|uniref:Uncharacterized protein n=1 Tax=Caerostris extrusa TaxID=172846 RepID=A0AAV4S8R8_CAEEX|nr:hypothetical protein CEXT_312931 [Caerostris extrusa]
MACALSQMLHLEEDKYDFESCFLTVTILLMAAPAQPSTCHQPRDISGYSQGGGGARNTTADVLFERHSFRVTICDGQRKDFRYWKGLSQPLLSSRSPSLSQGVVGSGFLTGGHGASDWDSAESQFALCRNSEFRVCHTEE